MYPAVDFLESIFPNNIFNNVYNNWWCEQAIMVFLNTQEWDKLWLFHNDHDLSELHIIIINTKY